MDGRIFRRWTPAAFSIFWGRLVTEAKVVDLHFHDLRHTFATWLQNLGVPLEVRAASLGHRLRGMGQDQLGGESMTAAYSHGGYGWNQQLRAAVSLLHNALLSYGSPIAESGEQLRVAYSRRDEGKVWWSQRDSNPCLSLERAPS